MLRQIFSWRNTILRAATAAAPKPATVPFLPALDKNLSTAPPLLKILLCALSVNLSNPFIDQ